MKTAGKIAMSILALTLSLSCGFCQTNPQFIPIPASFNVDSPNAVYALDINYDQLDLNRQVFHLFLPDTTGTFPLVVYIHGGAYTGGTPDKILTDSVLQSELKHCIENDIAFASFGYRVLAYTGIDSVGVMKSLNDSKRALQYVRYHSELLHLDPQKIALMGNSAGGSTSLWLGTRDDMAEPDASDPVMKESTRVTAVGVKGCQASLDIYRWETEVFHNFDGLGTNYTLDSMAYALGLNEGAFYGGTDSIYQLIHDPILIQYREDVDALYHMTNDDPPLYISNTSMAMHPGSDLYHHSLHGKVLSEAAIVAQVSEVETELPALDINTTNGESRIEFLVRHLKQSPSINQDLSELEWSNKVRVYPNPTSDSINIEVAGDIQTESTLYDHTGKVIITVKNADHLNLSTALPGIYLLEIKNTKTGQKTIKRIVLER